MSSKNHHVILRSRIEVTIDEHSQKSMLQHTLHKTIQKRIMPILSKLFSQCVPHDVVIHLDKLVIDGGSVHLSALDTQLPSQIEQVCMLKLKEQIGKAIHNPTFHQVIPLPDAKQQAIAHYLSEGNFAWWMVEHSEKQIEKIYLALLHHTPLRIEQLWYNLDKKEKAVQRCMTLFARSTVEDTLSCLLKQSIEYFRPILAEIGLLLYQAKILPNLLYTPGQQVLAMTLLGMINQQRSKIDRMGLLRMLLQQVAIQTSTSYEKILEKLHTYYGQNEGKSSCDHTTKALVLQLRDLVATPPKFWYQDVKNQEKVLKELDNIGSNAIAFHQLSAAVHRTKIAMCKAGIAPLVKSWLQEEKNREKLVKNLPDSLFIAFLASIDPSIVSIFSDLMQIAAAAAAAIAPFCAIKATTLAYCAFEYSKTLYLEEIKSFLGTYIANSLIHKQRFAALLTTQAYNPVTKAIMAPLVSISSAVFSSDALKTTIHQDGITHRKPGFARRTYLLDSAPSIIKKLLLRSSTIAHQPQHIVPIADAADRRVRIDRPIIQDSLAQEIPLSTLPLGRLETVLITLLQTTQCEVTIDWIKNILARAMVADPSVTERAYIARMVNHFEGYAPCFFDLSCDRLSHVDAFQTKHKTTSLEKELEDPLSDVVDFLTDNALPTDQSVPAYFIAKSLSRATLEQIRDRFMPLCQEAAILKKLMQHATEVVLSKLFQAFVTFPHQMLDGLARVIMQSKVLQRTQQETNIRFIKEIFITAAITHTPSTTAQQYIERILFHLSVQTSSHPTTLCDQLMDAAKALTDYNLVEVFSLLKENLVPLNLNKIDEVDLIFLSTHGTFAFDKALLPLYYSRLLPAIKHMVGRSVDLSQSVIDQLVAQHLPTLAKPLQETMCIALYNQITDVVQSKKDRVAERWYLFLHTGKLGNYSDGTALLNDVMAHLPTFSLAQHKTHVRQRLIIHFTHRQLMLLVQRHSEVGKTLANFIQGSYQLWCAIQGALGQTNSTKNLFWNGVLKTLPQTSIAQDDWLLQMITQLSTVLEITPTTLLETFQLLDTKGLPEGLTPSLNRLQEKYRQGVHQQAIQHGCKEPILIKLYLLLNGNLSLFVQQCDLSMHRLGDELVQCMADQPFVLLKFLEQQDNHPLVVRRMVHYFSQEVTVKLIACLAKDKSLFVMHYLDLLSRPLQQTTVQLHHSSTWHKELCISVICYLIAKRPFEETEFVHSTLFSTYYAQEAIYKIITSIVATKAASQEEEKVITLLKPFIQPINKSTIGQPTLANHPLEGVWVTKQKEPSQKIGLPEEEIRVYTKNTGLVFLWPFFYDFFRIHHLMVGNQFVCEQAVHNAVYLLQFLVTGKLKSSEWQLTLPKLLCGLSYDEVLLPYRSIDEAYDAYGQEEMEAIVSESEKEPQEEVTEQIEAGGPIASSTIEGIAAKSQLLIEKVIKRWKGLTHLKATVAYQDCTIENILKSYCLNRLGILTRPYADDVTETKFWHLTIMHQDHDKENLLPPWSMTRVKLPWMQEEIILFWMPQ